MRNLDPARAKWIRFRMGLLCGTMAVGLGGFVTSAYRVQVEDGATWKETAENQRQRRLHVEPKRGAIYDRNGAALAASVEVPSISGDVVEMLRGVEGVPAQAVVLQDMAVRIAAALSLDPNDVLAKLASKRRFVWLKRRVMAEEAQAVRDLGDPKLSMKPVKGLAVEGEGRRYYPGRELAGPVLGFVAPDGFGKDGLELSLDEELRGRAEEVRGLRDRSGRLIFSEGATDEGAFAGHDVTLAIDEGIQHVAERELNVAQGTYETKGASIVVMDPGSGEILAVASVPGYNPNDYSESEVEARRDRAVTDRFEPGSVMKVFTVAAALAAGSLKPTESIFCEHGTFQIANVTIHDTHENDWLTPTEVLAKSSNIGALKIGLELGEPALYAAFRRFGFGEPTGLPLPGEATGVLRPKGRAWFDVETANASFGQGISVSTVQLAVAMGAIANGGKLMEPILVRKVSDTRGTVVKEWTPHVRREVVPSSVARTVAEMLTAVVEEGFGHTGVEAAMAGFRVAGKTGTAQKVDSATGKYSQDHYTASFVGFVPAEKPRLVIAVVLDEPATGRYGGDLAGPVFRRVAEASLRYLGVPPTHSIPKIKTVTRTGDPADATLAAMKIDGAGGSPKIGSLPSDTKEAPVAPGPGAPAGPPPPSSVRVPDALGLGARDAVRAVGNAGLVPLVEGTGRLVKQVPSPGTPTPKGSSVRLVFEPGVMTDEGGELAREARSADGMTLADLAREIPGGRASVDGDKAVRCFGVHHDSRRIDPGDIFVVRRGEQHDGGAFVESAVARGAVAILAERGAALATSVPVLRVDDVATGLAYAAAAVYGHPAFSLDVLGITGTNGKTTTSHLVRAAIDGALGLPKCGVVGTIGHSYAGRTIAAAHTTPEADELARVLAVMRKRGATHVAMEVSSIALVLGRVKAVRFRVAAFTNLTQDHLDFHGSMSAYADAKRMLFTTAEPGLAVINVDDFFGAQLAVAAKCKVLRVRTTPGTSADGDVVPLAVDARASGMKIKARVPGGTVQISSRLVGMHNVENLLVAIGVASALDLDVQRAADALTEEIGAPGRLERCDGPGDDVVVLVDYAHTPDALARVLEAVRGVSRNIDEAGGSRADDPRLICVFGCGGDRDPTKRTVMGEAASARADIVIITSDNPRTEAPEAIAEPVEEGVREGGLKRLAAEELGAAAKGYVVELDRHRAIALAIENARSHDVVILAGKGHEDYQIVGTTKRPFDDRAEARAALATRRGKT